MSPAEQVSADLRKLKRERKEKQESECAESGGVHSRDMKERGPPENSRETNPGAETSRRTAKIHMVAARNEETDGVKRCIQCKRKEAVRQAAEKRRRTLLQEQANAADRRRKEKQENAAGEKRRGRTKRESI